jgi:hypothetical protein
MKGLVALVLMSFLLLACGTKLEKGSLEARVASLVEQNDQVFVVMSMDLNAILDKSGIFDGAIPAQYAAFITPYKSALYEAVNMEKPIYALAEGPISSFDGLHRVVVLVELKDADKFKKELKGIGLEWKSEKGMEYALKNDAAIAILDGKVGMMVINPQTSEGIALADLKAYAKQADQKAKDDKLIESIFQKGDITVVTVVDRIYSILEKSSGYSAEQVANFKKDAKDTYGMAVMNFEKGQATMDVWYELGPGMKKFYPMLENSVSSEALASLGGGSPIFAMAVNFEFEKFFNNMYEGLGESEKAEMNQALAMVGGKDKIAKMFTGEYLFAVYSGKEKSEPTINAYVGLNDGSYLRTLMDGFGVMMGMRSEGKDVYAFGEDAKILLNDKKMIATTNPARFNDLVNGKGGAIKAPGNFSFGKSPFSMFADFTKLDAKDFDPEMRIVLESLEYMTGEGSDKGFKVILVSKNKEMNILRNLIETGYKAYTEGMEYRNNMEDMEWDDEELEAFAF